MIVAMLIGLIGGPVVGDEPSLELSTAQYLNATKGLEDHYVPFSDHGGYLWSYNAMPDDLTLTYKLPSGVCSTCVLASSDWDANVTEFTNDCDCVLNHIEGNLAETILRDYDPSKPPVGTEG